MSFEPDEDQQELVALVRGILSQRADSAATRRAIASTERFDTDLWRLLCEEIGIAGMAIPEEFGGADFTLREAQLVLEEIGYSLAPSPYLGSVAIAAQAILATGDADAAARLLPGIAEGSSSAALAWAAPDDASPRSGSTSTPRTARAGSSAALSGFVLDGATADVLLVVAQTSDGPRLFEVIDTEAVAREDTPTWTRPCAWARCASTRWRRDPSEPSTRASWRPCVRSRSRRSARYRREPPRVPSRRPVGIREAAGAVRTRDRVVPGDQAPPGGHARAGGGRTHRVARSIRCSRHRSRRPLRARDHREGDVLPRRSNTSRRDDPAARRHRRSRGSTTRT